VTIALPAAATTWAGCTSTRVTGPAGARAPRDGVGDGDGLGAASITSVGASAARCVPASGPAIAAGFARADPSGVGRGRSVGSVTR
jgi:hypothetical protein